MTKVATKKPSVRDIQKELEIEANHQICPQCGHKRIPLKRILSEYDGQKFYSDPMWVCERKGCPLEAHLEAIKGWTKDFPRQQELVNYRKSSPRQTTWG